MVQVLVKGFLFLGVLQKFLVERLSGLAVDSDDDDNNKEYKETPCLLEAHHRGAAAARSMLLSILALRDAWFFEVVIGKLRGCSASFRCKLCTLTDLWQLPIK